MARAARDRGVDAAQTGTPAAMASRAPASSQPGRRAAQPRPCPASALPAGLSRLFPGTTVPRSSPAPPFPA